MCDVMVALPDATQNGRVVFAKNSDRPKGECQVVYFDPGGEQPQGAEAVCSYVSVPRGSRTHATLGMRPYWCWGYETGINSAGVVGGNAAVFTRHFDSVPADAPTPGLTGMDLLRLGLERGGSAGECVSEICRLLEEYGQWGSAVAGKNHEEGGYDNAFLLADGHEAWVLETSGRQWIAERVTSGVRTISNELSIRTEFDRSSSRLVEFATTAGALPDSPDLPFDFARAYEDHEHYVRQVSHIRRRRTTQLLSEAAGSIDEQTMMRVLRDHYENTFLGGPSFDQFLPDFHTVCMHDSPAGFTWGDTATSLVAELGGDSPIWISYSPPCSSVFVPIFFGEALPTLLASAGTHDLRVVDPTTCRQDGFSPDSLWWRVHRVVDAASANPMQRFAELRSVFDQVQDRAKGRASTAPTHSRSEVAEACADDFLQGIAAIESRWNLAEVNP